jgi:group I intron endonuclease
VVNNKKYVGLTCNIKRRYKQHKSARSRAVVFCLAIKKYGFGNFNFEVLQTNLSLEEAKSFEKLQIKELKALVPNGYNRTEGGDSSVRHTPETIEKIRAKNILHCLNHGASMQGRKHSDETKKLLRDAALKRENRPCGNDHWNYGKKTSEATLEKMRSSQTRGNNGFATKVIDLNTNIIYSCIKDATEVYNISHSHVSMICAKKRKSSKYNFAYLKDYEKQNSIPLDK